ncbi:Vacuolar protein sorting-associated protein 16 [Exophiala xenobiotica]|uniref:Probable vacuolar protein sorting-associated protein 16 homolog n=1 Tax=Vermiconidia calcicola TaxID=1690605 RepID=A0AAV9Q027_9PEZI|nr:Vacuolar protein sorting-associated protein 16 [Exophiala xenobiotica]KAK5531656.1 Vacuolar protein sorting-associated protein 16 [Chaetothyriales sp. CCFEE 6169]KAK5532416.1 Vacuolar protein sorting-associated protein 16 [Vermiconidia calcicola]KAK5295561.1 Vacuolar protein sorting-associated protein 16 [Exophiala xenobiotica]KAK5333789.1 Vacuolar protein sorting-associated protein 16 [Exophiala xenobiotica]
MTSNNPRAGWEKIGDQFYQKVQLYESVFDADLELENYFVAGAPYGGALALWRDASKVARYRTGQSTKSTIDIYSSSGKLISNINWEKGPIKGLGWSDDEKLLVVTEDGIVHCYFGLHGDFQPFLLGHGAEEYGVVSCRFWSQGFVALLGNNTLIAVSSFDEPRPRVLAQPPEGEVHSWSLIPPAYTLSRSVEVLLAIDKTIYVVDASESEDRGLSDGPFKHISVSPNGRFAALYTEDGKVWVVGSDFQNKYSEYDSKAKTTPTQICWCGNDSVILAWEDEVHMVGPNGAAVKYYYDDQVHVVADIDGVRLITNEACEFLHKVPDPLEEIFKLGSTSAASVLVDSIELLEKKSPKADENIQRIKPNLPEAVETCIRAAGDEFNHNFQKQLLRAASFGKSVLDLYSSDEFVDMCEDLRVLNAVRDFRIGLFLSYEQYCRLTPERLIARLVNRRKYLLAIKLSDFLHLPSNKIYVHWASQKVRSSSGDDDAIRELVVERLRGKHGISFETIARAAYDEGRSHLATTLLNHEPRAGKQVPLLLNMEEDEIALNKAIESGDSDLVFFVLLQLKSKLPLATFLRTISEKPVAAALVESSARAQDQDLLKDLYYQDDRPVEGSNLLLEDAMHQPQVHAVMDKLKLAARLLTDAKDPTAIMHTRALTEATQLLKMQEAFDKEITDSSGSFLGLSINETMYRLIKSGYSKRAASVQSAFKVPEKSWWWVRLRALTAARLWGEVEEIAKSKKSPIGWEPFYNEVLGAGNTRLASSFIPKCTSLQPAERIEMWVKCGMIVKAGEEALKAKDLASLESLRDKANGQQHVEIERMLTQLRPKK